MVPASVRELIVTAAEPVFLSVTVCASLVCPITVTGKAIEVGLRDTAGAVALVPVPLSFTLCGDPDALSAIDNAAVSAPAAAGLNSTEIVQLALAASELPHVVADFTNELALVPVIVSDVSVSAAVPEFFNVTTCAAVVAPTVVEAKVRLVGDSVTAGAVALVPVPVSFTLCGEPRRCQRSTTPR